MFTLRLVFLFSATCIVFAQPSADALSHLRYRYIGPVGNRVDAAVSVPGDPKTYYAGAASGGIFKSTDGATHLATTVWTEKIELRPKANSVPHRCIFIQAIPTSLGSTCMAIIGLSREELSYR